MAIDGTPRAGHDLTIGLVSCAASWGLLMRFGVDVIDLAPLALAWVPIAIGLTREAVRAGNPVAITISLVFMVGLLGVGSVGVLGHTGVSLSAVGEVAALWLMAFMSLAVQLTWRR